MVFLGFYTVNLLCFRGNRVNIEGVSTDKATRKSVHKFWRDSQFSFFDVYYFHVCVKFMIFSKHQKNKKSLFMRQLSKKVHHLESAQHTFSDHSKTLVFSDVIKKEMKFLNVRALLQFIPIPCTPKKLYRATLSQ